MRSDEHNLLLVESIDSVDAINASFYGRFPYPWTAAKFDYLHDPDFHADMLNQEIGDWDHARFARGARVWVAGCGTNQAVFTALRFPRASVVGSDVSSTSLDICAATARELGIGNLELRQESLNHVDYREQFDYVLCTGVIHHNADPRASLDRLSAALKPGGVMELMIYNRFHWIIPVAFQQAIRTLAAGAGGDDFDGEMSLARRIIRAAPQSFLLRSYLARYGGGVPEAMIADELLQPVLYSYTVESLQEMAAACNLELLLPCLNQFDRETGNYPWNMTFDDPVLTEIYESLPDARRWQVTNLLLLERSPMLWFYLQRADSGRPPKTEREVCEGFLDTVFARAATTQSNFIRTEEGPFQLSPNVVPYPPPPPDALTRRIVDAVDGRTPMRAIFARLGLETTFHAVNEARLKLTTPAFPYLRAVARAGEGGADIDLTGVDTRKLAEEKFKKFKSVKPKAVNG